MVELPQAQAAQVGSFLLCCQEHVPVVPCFITMEDSDRKGADGFPIQEYTIHICEPIYPDPEKSPNKNANFMMAKNYEVWKEIYEKTYGIPLVYTTEKNDAE